ncbi:protoporphyrinogen oxidase [uncultured Microscilla sp.]|uniref:protoporphyrinogen oxidase n=1 Tax=uncultured Microscilla sp. TaxID=432653 RepID=UPI00262D559B|nr:protoporphyrinogen oxidase [uncultured Microscilla sp.]
MIGIIGAGISGLSLAFYLQKLSIPYILLEASEQAGGYIRSMQENSINRKSYILELGPNSIMLDSELKEFISEIGLQDELLPSNDVSQNRYIFRAGKYRKLPSKPLQLLFNSFFSFSSKVAVFKERNKPKQTIENETLTHFFERRFSREIVDYALNPFVAGIYAGDPDQLLVAKAFPQLYNYEQQHGSVLKGFIKNKGAERRKPYSFKKGMQTLPEGIAQQLTHLKLGKTINNIQKNNNGFVLYTNEGQTYDVKQLVIATSAPAAQSFLSDTYPEFSQALGKIYYPPLTAVHSAYKRHEVKHLLNGFGGLNPKIEGLYTSGSIWSSSVFPGRCPDEEVLFTTFVGGSQLPQNTTQSEQITLGKVHQELSENYQITNSPIYRNMHKWDKALPQYDVNILEAHHIAEQLENEQVFVCANWKDGVSLPDCIKKGKQLAEQLAKVYAPGVANG